MSCYRTRVGLGLLINHLLMLGLVWEWGQGQGGSWEPSFEELWWPETKYMVINSQFFGLDFNFIIFAI